MQELKFECEINVEPKFEEYALFVNDTARFTDRRQGVNNLYMTVNTFLLTATTFLAKEILFGPHGHSSLLPDIALCLLLAAGIAVCLTWQSMLDKYGNLVKLRIHCLRTMEDKLPNSIRMYHAEDQLYPRDTQGHDKPGKGLNFSNWEKNLPIIFGRLYGFFLCCAVISLFLRLWDML